MFNLIVNIFFHVDIIFVLGMIVPVKIRIGVEGGRKPVLEKAKLIGAPILVSANSLWDNKRKRFSGWQCYAPHDTALDSSGFVAMKLYGGYRWTVSQYVALAREMRPTWWAQMDFCCEPEIAGNRTEVFARIDKTAEHLNDCSDTARQGGIPDPMPVLQGWEPRDYCEGPIYSTGYAWPSLVGIGSVCRRAVRGANGILSVLGALESKVPPHVRYHLFGVKSSAIAELRQDFSHRIESIDSMAWAFAARCDARKAKTPCTGVFRAEAMASWYSTQLQTQTPIKNTQLSLSL